MSALDVDFAAIRASTSRFIDTCMLVHTGGTGAGSLEDLAIIEDLYAGDEAGGTYTIPARPARDEQTVLRKQGEVWQRLAAVLRAKGISVEKPRDAAGYEVDAEIVNGKRRLLIEIKSTASAADVYGGIGQLLIYRKLMPRLAEHVPVLLLPARPRASLVSAIGECGVRLCTY